MGPVIILREFAATLTLGFASCFRSRFPRAIGPDTALLDVVVAVAVTDEPKRAKRGVFAVGAGLDDTGSAFVFFRRNPAITVVAILAVVQMVVVVAVVAVVVVVVEGRACTRLGNNKIHSFPCSANYVIFPFSASLSLVIACRNPDSRMLRSEVLALTTDPVQDQGLVRGRRRRKTYPPN